MLTFGLAAIASAAQNADVEGSREHPTISRIDGSNIVRFEQKEFDEYRLMREPVSGYQGRSDKSWGELVDALNDVNCLSLEGKVSKLTYRVSKNRSTLEVIRGYQAVIAVAGFEMLYKCKTRECAGPSCERSFSEPPWLELLARC